MINFKNFRKASQTFFHDHIFRMKSVSVAPRSCVSNLENADSFDNDVRVSNIQVNDESPKRSLTQETSINNSATEYEESRSLNEVVSNLPLNKCVLWSRALRNKKYSNRRLQDIHSKKSSSKESDASVALVKSDNVKCTDSQHATPINCRICGKKFRLQKSYRTHMRIHTGEKPFTCHVCGKQFGQTGSLYYHLKHVHDGVKNHSCDICGRSFAMKTAMEDHRRIHTGERPYVCDSCGKTFKTKASLYIHNRTHTNEYPHKCTYCSKAFRWRQQMLGHLTTHTGEKNYTCDTCGKGFGVRNDLTRHKRVHSEEKPYTCQQCGLSFAQKRYLKGHERTRHKVKD